MINTLTQLFKQLVEGEDLAAGDNIISPNFAIACLLYEVANADNEVDDEELLAQSDLLTRLLDVDKIEADQLIQQARQQDTTSLFEFTNQLRELSYDKRIELIEAMWHVAFSDNHLDPLEDSVIRKTADLLYVNHNDFIRSKIKSHGQ